jgi:transposase
VTWRAASRLTCSQIARWRPSRPGAEAHPPVEIVSRDGSSEYAAAITKGAPHARQVSDRWHLVKNLATCVSVQLADSLAQMRRAEPSAAATAPQEEQPSYQLHSHPRTQAEQRTQQARQAERLARYEQIIALRRQGMKHTDIAAQVGMAARTVREWRETVGTCLTLAPASKDPVSLAPTSPTCFHEGLKAVARDPNWKEN